MQGARSLRTRNPNVDYTCRNDVEADMYSKHAAIPTSSLFALTKAADIDFDAKYASENEENQTNHANKEESPSIPKRKKKAGDKTSTTAKPKKQTEEDMSTDATKEVRKRSSDLKTPRESSNGEGKKKTFKKQKRDKSSNQGQTSDAVAVESIKKFEKQTKAAAPSSKPNLSVASSLASAPTLAIPVSMPFSLMKQAQASQSKTSSGNIVDKVQSILQEVAEQSTMEKQFKKKEEQYSMLHTKYTALLNQKKDLHESWIQQVQEEMEAKQKAADELVKHYKAEAERAKAARAQEIDPEVHQKALKDCNFLKGETLALQQKVNAQNKAMEEIQSSLEAERREFQLALKEKDDALQAAKMEAKSKSPDQTKLLQMYQLLTGVQMTPEAGGARCNLINKSDERKAEFTLKMQTTEFEYIPGVLNFGAVVPPEYLNETICFDFTEAPVFLKNVLSGVYCRGDQ